MKKTIILLVFAIVLQSCATILGGVKDTTRVTQGTPEGAKVYLNGNYISDAPCNVRVNKNVKSGINKIEIKAEGYETQTINMTRKVSIGYVVADAVCTGWIGLIVDFATGCIYKPRPNRIKYSLNKK